MEVRLNEIKDQARLLGLQIMRKGNTIADAIDIMGILGANVMLSIHFSERRISLEEAHDLVINSIESYFRQAERRLMTIDIDEFLD